MHRAVVAALCALSAGPARALVLEAARRPVLFVGINSKLDHVEAREAHRASWMQHPLVRDGTVEAKFLLASRGAVPEDEHAVTDLLRLPGGNEGYNELTGKTLAFLRWFKASCHADYLMKLDDDSYPHLYRLMPYLKGNSHKMAYMGYLSENSPVLRTGKNAEGVEGFSREHYAPYMQGAGYILSWQLVEEIMKPEYAGTYLYNENTTVGERVAQANETVQEDRKVFYENLPGTERGCHSGDVISLNWSPELFLCTYQKEERSMRFGQGVEDICCTHEPH